MVLEYPFNELVKQIRGYQLMDVGAWKVICERLVKKVSNTSKKAVKTYNNVSNQAI